MNKLVRILLFLVMIVYVISPVDLIPGSLVDDVIVFVATMICNGKIKRLA